MPFSAKAAAAVLLAALALAGAYLSSGRGATFRRLKPLPAARLEAAIAGAQERLKSNPQDIPALEELGLLHFQKGKEYYPEGINELEQARELGALDPKIFYYLGLMYQEVGLYSYALDDYRRFLRHYPEDKEARLLAAKLLYGQGEFSEAILEYERLKARFPKDPLIEENLGLSLREAKQTERAVASFKELRAFPGDTAKRAELYLGQLALDLGRYQEALDHLSQCRLAPGSPGFGIPADQVDYALATAYQKAGRLEEAGGVWEEFLKEIPANDKRRSLAVNCVRDLKRRLALAKRHAKTRKS